MLLVSSIFSLALLSIVKSEEECKCGIENIKPRIINGRRSAPGTFPWVVYIEEMKWFSRTKCTGSIISPSFIMTAAHCVPEDESPHSLTVYTYQGCGIRRLRSGPKYKVKKVIRNKDFKGTMDGDDIALLQLESPIRNAMPICLPKTVREFKNLVVAGWGMENKGYDMVDYDCLNEVEVATVSPQSCWLLYRMNRDKVMCAGGDTGVCEGDSGGPLMSRTNGLVYQAGVTSFTRTDCGVATKTPAGFERVVNHLDWIKSNSFGACFK